eukprot:5834604-Prymnesium_polylepis.1
MLCYLSFFISRHAVPARVGVVMISLLGLINLSNTVRSALPRFAHGSWILNMINSAQIFVLFAAFEYACANMLTRSEARIKTARLDQEKREAKAKGKTIHEHLSPTDLLCAEDAEMDPAALAMQEDVDNDDDDADDDAGVS